MELNASTQEITEQQTSFEKSVRDISFSQCIIYSVGSFIRGEFISPSEVKAVLESLSPIETAGLSNTQIISGFSEYKMHISNGSQLRLSKDQTQEAIEMYRITLGMEIPEGIYTFAQQSVKNGAPSLKDAVSVLINAVSKDQNEVIVRAIHGDSQARNMIKNAVGIETPYGKAIDSLSTAHYYTGFTLDRIPSIESMHLDMDQLMLKLERMLALLGLNSEELRKLLQLLLLELRTLKTSDLTIVQRIAIFLLNPQLNPQLVFVRKDE